MKKNLVSLIFICLLSSLTLVAQGEKQFTGSLLWKVSGGDASQLSYLLGTHHLVDVSFLEEVRGYKEAFEQCDVIVGEMNLANKEKMMQSMEKAVTIGVNEKGYEDLLSVEELQDLSDKLLQYLGVPLAPFIQMKPALLSTLLAVKLHQIVEPFYDPQKHVLMDEYVQIEGRKRNKQILGLETVEDQIKVLFSDSMKEQLDDLICSLNEMELGEKTYRKLNEYYKAGDLSSLYTLSIDEDPTLPKSSCPMSDEKMAKICDERNKKWMEQLPELLKANSLLIVVGALHLPGEEGLLFQLDKLGYKVERVK